MPTTLTVEYAADEDIAVTTLNSLAAGNVATSELIDNTSNLYVDMLVGGKIDTAGTGVVAGEHWDVYLSAVWDTTAATNAGGGVDTALTASDSDLEVAAGAIEAVLENMKLVSVVRPEAETPATSQAYHWGPVSVASYFGGVMPQKFLVAIHNNTNGALSASGHLCTGVGIKYVST